MNQLVTPNLDPVVYQNGKVLTDWLGWCLAVAWTAFKGKTTNPTAWEAWRSVAYPHAGTPPNGVYVPVWFSGFNGMGHVAIYKDGKVWSSPYTHKTSMDVLNGIGEVERIYGVKYVGWSEDIGSVRVVEEITGGKGGIANMDEFKKNVYRKVLHREPEDNQAWQGLSDDVNTALLQVGNSPEWLGQNHVFKIAYPEAMKQLDNMQTIVNSQSQKIASLQQTIQADNISDQDKQKVLDSTLSDLAKSTDQLEACHEKVMDAQLASSEVTDIKNNISGMSKLLTAIAQALSKLPGINIGK